MPSSKRLNPAKPQRQISLPLAKAVAISFKNIRKRLSRSLLVTSGIILAMAFLMSIQTQNAVVNGLRTWIVRTPSSPRFAELRTQEAAAGQVVEQYEQQLRAASARGPTTAPAAFNAKESFGTDLHQLLKELSSLPASVASLTDLFRADPSQIQTMQKWIDAKRDQRRILRILGQPQQLEARMKANGVPVAAEAIAKDRAQTRWLLCLALLVAFVGILNAMLMAVTERFREIGTMKCLGALDSFIIKLFLIESLFQGIVGTVAGIVIGLSLTLVQSLASYGSLAAANAPVRLILVNAASCFGLGVFLSVAAALYPAWQAARMQPVEAMRSET